MALQFLFGSSGSGKTYRLYEEMISRSLKDDQTPLLLIVPEQFTLQTQQELLQMHPRKSIMNIEVLSFQRLAYRIYDDLSLADRVILKDTGKSMVIRKLVEAAKENYPMLYPNIRRKGYIKELKGLITEFYQYNFTEDAYDKIQNEIKNPLLREKIKDSHTLFKDFKDFLGRQYLTPENTMDLLVEGIPHNEWLKSAHIYLDGFYGFTPIQYDVIAQLLKKTREVSVAITMDCEEQFDSMEDSSQLFYESKKMFQTLRSIVEKEKIDIKEALQFSEPLRFVHSPELSHLEKNIFRYPYQPYVHKPQDIKMFCASNMRKEVLYVADSIMKLIMSNTYRFKEIAVVTGDLSGYENQIKQVLELYNIPYFMDQKKSIMSHPITQWLVATLEVLSKDFSYDSVLRYLKTGLIGIEARDIDLMENYVLAYGIRGYKGWLSPWNKPYPQLRVDEHSDYAQDILNRMNAAKACFLEPLLQFRTECHQKECTVEIITRGIFGVMKSLNLEKKISDMALLFELEGNLIYQKEYTQIFKILVDVLDQLVEILGKQSMQLKEFIKLLEAGLEESEMGLVPPGLDQVVVGDLERTRLKEIKALFVIGFNEGKIPKVVEQGKIISDYERIQLKELGISLAPDNKENIFKEQLSLYMGLLRTRKLLYLSYSKSDFQGKPMRPSLLLLTIKKIFPNMKVLDIDDIYVNKCVVNRPAPTFEKLLTHILKMDLNDPYNHVSEVYKWFTKETSWLSHLQLIQRAICSENQEALLDAEMIKDLYGDELRNSVSRLEAFAKCPFAHFIDYGLHLNERLDYAIKMPDIGILFHRAIDLCSRKIEQRGLSWNTLAPIVRDGLVEESVSEVVGEEQRGIYKSSARNAYLVKRLTRITKRALWAISQQISRGEFRPMDYEIAFDASKNEIKALTIDFENQKSMRLSGRIDRVDAYEEEDALYLSVIDYKSGNQSFDLVALYYGLQLQLLVYLNAVTELKKNALNHHLEKVVPAGVFYFHIDDPIIKDISERNPQVIESMILKELKLKGLVLDHQNIIRKMDGTMEKTSEIIPVSMTNQGELSKSSSVASLEQFEDLQRFVDVKIKELGSSIVQGELGVKPYKRKGETGCDYCQYLSVCRFEQGVEGNAYNLLKEISRSDLWDKIGHKLTEDNNL